MQLAFVLDCSAPERLADFWTAALGYERGESAPPYVSLSDPAGRRPVLLLQRVPEPKVTKNRMHLDLRISDMDAELDRITALGAAVVRAPFPDAGWLIAMLADPEGNEFCLIVPPEKEKP